MRNFLTIFQVIVSILLIAVILMQEKGLGLSAAFGGGGEFYRSKRGIDKVLFGFTVILSVLFVGGSLAFLFVS
ncbi:preprotein translocase subunit SecG [Candidatus Peregrinibacteria bacterium]|nr:preprotein translocase subunit SecG [Candidatus Peregrinibacteria bacterium]